MAEYMNKFMSAEFKVGLTVIVSTLILIFGIIWGKEFRLHTDKYELDILFENVGGMIPGDPVTVNGVKEGKVARIGWQGRNVLCTIQLNNRVQLYEDAVFTVISAELLAGMKVEIFPGKSPRKINLSHQPFHGSYGGRIVDVGIVIGELAEDMSALSFRVDSTISMINSLLETGHLQKNISGSLSNINAITKEFRSLPTRFGKTLNGLDSVVTRINSLVRNNDQGIGRTLHNLNSITLRLDTVTTSMQSMLTEVQKKRGLMGKMIYDSTLYIRINKTLLSVDSLAKQIKDEGLELDLF